MEFGFDKPLLRVKLTYNEMKPKQPGAKEDVEQLVTKVLIVGKPTTSTGGQSGTVPGRDDKQQASGNPIMDKNIEYYARLDGPDQPVFVVTGPWASLAKTRPLDLLDRDLLTLDRAAIKQIKIAGPTPEQSLVLARSDNGAWKVEGADYPIDAGAVDQLLNVVADLPISSLEAYGAAVKWAEYGLEKSPNTVTVTTGGDKPTTNTIAIGKAGVDPATRFARVDDGKAVALLDPAAAAALLRTRLEYVNRTLLAFSPDTLTTLSRKKGKDRTRDRSRYIRCLGNRETQPPEAGQAAHGGTGHRPGAVARGADRRLWTKG